MSFGSRSTLVVGAQFGDEGKGKVVDMLVGQGEVDVVVRYNGGANAGHTIVLDDGKYPLHLIPSGILHPQVTNIVAAGVVVDPVALVKEVRNLQARGVGCANLLISDRAHLVMPWHQRIDAHLGGRLGTTARGIGPCYEDRASRRGLRVGDLVDEEGQLDRDHFAARVREVCAEKNLLMERVYGLEPLDPEAVIAACLEAGEVFRSQVCDTSAEIAALTAAGKVFLYEGAQGSLLDVDWGTYPYVTSSSVSLAGCYLGSGNCVLPELRMGVVKAYGTRVGEGPFPAELGSYCEVKERDRVEPGQALPRPSEQERRLAIEGDAYWMGRWIRSVGAEYGTTTGRPRRCGWLDLVAVGHAARISGLNALAVTKLDVLDGIPRLKICVAYERAGRRTQSFPARCHRLDGYVPVYEELPGWESLGAAQAYQDLPAQARSYLRRIQEVTGVAVRLVSIGSHRSQTLLLDKAGATA